MNALQLTIRTLLVLLGSSLILANMALAMPVLQPAYIVRPIDASFSVANFGTAVPTRAIDNSGMSATLDTFDPVPAIYPSHGTVGHPGDASLTNGTQTFTMIYDLGAVYDLNTVASMHLWNYNETGGAGRGIRIADVLYTSTGANIGTASGWQTAVNGALFTPATGVGYTGSDYTMLNGLTARFVRFDVTANHSNTLGGGDFTGISEIRFITAEVLSTIPEPSTAALLVIGAVSLGWQTRRRGRQAV